MREDVRSGCVQQLPSLSQAAPTAVTFRGVSSAPIAAGKSARGRLLLQAMLPVLAGEGEADGTTGKTPEATAAADAAAAVAARCGGQRTTHVTTQLQMEARFRGCFYLGLLLWKKIAFGSRV